VACVAGGEEPVRCECRRGVLIGGDTGESPWPATATDASTAVPGVPGGVGNVWVVRLAGACRHPVGS
jgi:hypothetical protein